VAEQEAPPAMLAEQFAMPRTVAVVAAPAATPALSEPIAVRAAPIVAPAKMLELC
jgi:hypothetical protein